MTVHASQAPRHPARAIFEQDRSPLGGIVHEPCSVSTCHIPTQDVICNVHARETALNLKLLCVEHGGGPSLLEELDVVITRQAKIVGPPIGIVVRNGEPRLPFDDPASNLRIEVYRELATWGVVAMNNNPHLQRVQRTPAEVGEWLSSRTGFISNLPDAAAFYEVMKRKRAEVERMIDRPPVMVLLGDCAAELDEGGECKRYIYAPLDDENRPPAYVRCPQCGTEHDVLRRQQAMIAKGRLSVGTAAEVSRVLGRVGIPLPASTIRSWAQHRVSRGQIIEPKIEAVDWTDDNPPRPLYGIEQVASVYVKSLEKKGKAA